MNLSENSDNIAWLLRAIDYYPKQNENTELHHERLRQIISAPPFYLDDDDFYTMILISRYYAMEHPVPSGLEGYVLEPTDWGL